MELMGWATPMVMMDRGWLMMMMMIGAHMMIHLYYTSTHYDDSHTIGWEVYTHVR